MSYTARKAIRFPKDHIFSDGFGESVCLEVTEATRRLILSMVERVSWSIWIDEEGKSANLEPHLLDHIAQDIGKIVAADGCYNGLDDSPLVDVNAIKERFFMCGCNQCGCETGFDINDILQGDGEGQTIVPPEPTGTAEPASDLCDRATQYAGGYVEVMARMKVTFSGITATIAAIEVWIAGVGIWNGWMRLLSSTVMALIMQAVVALIVATNATDIASDAAQVYEEDFKCAVAGADSSLHAKSRFLSVLQKLKNTHGRTPYTLFWVLAQLTDWDTLYSDESVIIQPEYIDSDCSECEGYQEPPASECDPLPIGQEIGQIEWVDSAGIAIEFDPLTTTSEAGDSHIDVSFLISTSDTTWDLDVNCVPPTAPSGSRLVGFTFYVKTNTASGNDSDGINRVHGSDTLGDRRWLWVAGGFEPQFGVEQYDRVGVENDSFFDLDHPIQLYNRIGVSGTPPVSGQIHICSIHWAMYTEPS